MSDRLSDFYEAAQPRSESPWRGRGAFECDYRLLQQLIQVAADTGRADNAQTGGVALALDVWVACELRRAGLDPDSVWPRAETPRVLPPSLAREVRSLPLLKNAQKREVQERLLFRLVSSVGSGRATIVGGQFPKEVDVVIADSDRGLELAVSTKGMTDSYGNNITNRWEEASGDLLNIRRRFPLAAFGFLLLVTTPVLEEPGSWARLKDMMRKLTSVVPGAESSAYDAAAVVLADWPGGTASLSMGEVPEDLSPSRFFERMLLALFARSPVVSHGDARDLWLASDPPNAPE